ncbi:DNA polymerase III subunit alpha [Pedobacter sp. Hv1]|uniref:DNA polymerase III subunit alpha n=1 Tax=Pedobacter sp. Hv1 TaxID=1740090 RepID=UPI0006D8C5A6|nr:DNA polymerase III subunit alpha [Pedobacter sp. Hv1]KQC00956.1 DNA polymerase III subunit alpha [Pedobacter sp. Hv1]
MFLNVHSQYSLRYGTLKIKDLIAEARAKDIHQLVLTDINNSTGCMELIRLCRKENFDQKNDEGEIIKPAYHIKPIIGIEFRRDHQLLYIGIAKNKEGMKELNDFLTYHNLNELPLPVEPFSFNHAFVVYPYGKKENLKDHEYLGIRANELHKIVGKALQAIKHKLVVFHPVTVKDKIQHRLHKYLRAIALNTVLGKLTENNYCQQNEWFISENELRDKFASYAFILENTQRLLDSCTTDDYLFGKKNKKYFKGSAQEDLALLTELAMKGLAYRYGNDNEEALKRINKELKVIDELNFSAYFLITWDVVRYAMEERGFYHVGRGSGANSIVAYCLKITDVDPIALDLYFERFLNHKRSSPPDFDIDFSWDERPSIQNYIFKKYPHTALLGTMSSFKDRAIIREIGKVMGLPKSEIDDFTDPTKEKFNLNNPVFNKILLINSLMKDMPNQRSIHAGGILIGEEPLTYYTALDLPPKGFPTVQWDMYEAEEIGLDKYDILSQRGIGHIREAVQLILKNKNKSIEIHNFKAFKTDPKLNAQLRAGTPIGCFYIESPAMRQLLKKLQCEDYKTLVAASSIIRPGVASSGMMKMYIQSYHHPEAVNYLDNVMKEQLEETFGIMVYQEDVIKVCCHYAGLDLADADILRRGMSGKYRTKNSEFEKLSRRFFTTAKSLGRDEEVTKEVWRQVSSFAGFSFSKAHSASFAVESYQSLYLKTYYPKEFMVAVLNNYGGFYQRWVYVHALQQTGARVHLPCVNHSDSVVNINADDAYLGLIGIQGLENKLIDSIPQERKQNGKYIDLEDLIKRTYLSLEQSIILIRIGALRFTGKTKKELLWEVHNYLGNSTKPTVGQELFHLAAKSYVLPVLESHLIEDAYQELELLGFPVSLSMFDLLKTAYRGDVLANDLVKHEGKIVKMLGNFVCDKTVYTIKNTKMWFGTFIDREGSFFDTTHFPNSSPVYPFRGKGCYLILGKVMLDFGVPSVEVIKFAKLPIVDNPVLKV